MFFLYSFFISIDISGSWDSQYFSTLYVVFFDYDYFYMATEYVEVCVHNCCCRWQKSQLLLSMLLLFSDSVWQCCCCCCFVRLVGWSLLETFPCDRWRSWLPSTSLPPAKRIKINFKIIQSYRAKFPTYILFPKSWFKKVNFLLKIEIKFEEIVSSQ